LGEAKYYYDGHQPTLTAAPTAGDLTCTRVYLNVGAGGDCPATPAKSANSADTYGTYDVYGRMLSSEDGEERTSTTSYTPTTGGLPTLVLASAPAVQPSGPTLTTTTAVNWRGEPTNVTDPRSKVTTLIYDGLGRL